MKMLNPNFGERISAFEALNSNWFKMKKRRDDHSHEAKKDVIRNLHQFHVRPPITQHKNKFKALVYTYIGTQLQSNKEK